MRNSALERRRWQSWDLNLPFNVQLYPLSQSCGSHSSYSIPYLQIRKLKHRDIKQLSSIRILSQMASWNFSFYLLCPPSLCSFHDIMLSACVGLVLFPGDIWILSHLGWDLQEKKKSWPVVLRVSVKRATDAYKIVCPCRHMKYIFEVSKAILRQPSQHKTRCVDADSFFLKMEVVFFLCVIFK